MPLKWKKLYYRFRNWLRPKAMLIEWWANQGTPRAHTSLFPDYERWKWEENQRKIRMARYRRKRIPISLYRKVDRKLTEFNKQLKIDVIRKNTV